MVQSSEVFSYVQVSISMLSKQTRFKYTKNLRFFPVDGLFKNRDSIVETIKLCLAGMKCLDEYRLLNVDFTYRNLTFKHQKMSKVLFEKLTTITLLKAFKQTRTIG